MTPNGPDRTNGDPFAADLLPDRSLEGRLRALGLGDRDSDRDVEDAHRAATELEEGHEGDSEPRLAAIGAQLNTLSSGLAAHRVHLRDAERSLVDRIADVDDDRRRAQGQIARALQTQRDELEKRMRRQGWLTALALLLIGALAGGGLYLVHQRLAGAQGPLSAQVQRLRDELAQLSGIASQGALVQEKLDTLSAAVGALSGSLDEVADRRAPVSGANSPEVAALLEQIGRLGAEQQRLRDELLSLRDSGATAPGPVDVTPTPEPDSAGTDTPAPGPEDAVRQTSDQTGDTLSESPAGPGAGETVPAQAAEPKPPPAEPAQNTDSPAVAGAEATADQTYALQLIGFYSYDKLREFAAQPDLPREVYLRRETLRGRPWFVLIHSLHASYADAQAALERLPPSLVAMGPWIRKLPAGDELVPIPTAKAP